MVTIKLVIKKAVWVSLALLLAFTPLAALPIPAHAQLAEPDVFFGVQQTECFRHVLETNDQLYLILGRIEYTTPPTAYDTSQSYIVRLMNGAIELGTTTFYPYHNNGYDLGICSIYFDATSAPAWGGGYSMSIEGNPTLHWLDSSATTAMDGAVVYDDDTATYTDQTAESNSAAANDMSLPPSAAAEVGDAYYFGSSGMFNILTVNIGTNGDWTGTYAWEFWNGSSWVVPNGLTDGTTGFTAGVGNHDVTFTCPTNWRSCVVNGVELYWLRFRIATQSAFVTQPLGTQSWINTLSTPPNTSSAVINWIDEGSVIDAQERLTTRCRTLGLILENDWGGTTDLVESIAGVSKLTESGEDYFVNSIGNLREMCPDLFADIMLTPEFPEVGFVQDYYMGGDDADYDVYGVNWYAQTFTPTESYSISGVDLKMFRVGTPGTVTVGVRATAAGLPTGADLATGTIDGDDFTTDTRGAWYEVSFTTDYAITPGTTYAIVPRVIGGAVTDYVGWLVDTAGTYTAGQACSSGDSGVTWAAVGGGDFMFSVRASVGGIPAYTMSYRNRLANQLVGTRFDMTDLGQRFNLSRMWMSTIVWIIFACTIPTIFFCRAVQSFKPATLVFAVMLPFGAQAGFIYLEIAIVAAFLCASAAIFVFFYRPGG